MVSCPCERVFDGQIICAPSIMAGSDRFKIIGILTAKESSYPSFPPLRADFFTSSLARCACTGLQPFSRPGLFYFCNFLFYLMLTRRLVTTVAADLRGTSARCRHPPVRINHAPGVESNIRRAGNMHGLFITAAPFSRSHLLRCHDAACHTFAGAGNAWGRRAAAASFPSIPLADANCRSPSLGMCQPEAVAAAAAAGPQAPQVITGAAAVADVLGRRAAAGVRDRAPVTAVPAVQRESKGGARRALQPACVNAGGAAVVVRAIGLINLLPGGERAGITLTRAAWGGGRGRIHRNDGAAGIRGAAIVGDGERYGVAPCRAVAVADVALRGGAAVAENPLPCADAAVGIAGGIGEVHLQSVHGRREVGRRRLIGRRRVLRGEAHAAVVAAGMQHHVIKGGGRE